MSKKPNEPCDGCGDPPEESRAYEGLVVTTDHPANEIQPQPATAGKQLVDGERWSDYGDPRLAWDRVARLWTVVLGQHVTARQAVLCMIGLKVVRETINSKADNLEDIEGYTEILRRLG